MMNFNNHHNNNNNNSSSRNFSLGLGIPPRVGIGSPNVSQTGATSSGAHHHHQTIKYVYELPYLERKEICRIFDENNLWETLGGGLMGYSSGELSEFGRSFLRGASPTDSLLTSWASQNHTILELFTLFGRLTHYRAMKVIAKFVDPKYHAYIRDPEVNATQDLIQLDAINPVVSPVTPVAPSMEPKVQNNVIVAPIIKKSNKDEVNKGQPEVHLDKRPLSAAYLQESMGSIPQIPYQELLQATNSWDRRNILGKGGFGTVYKGTWKNTAVAIKRMEQRANHVYVESQIKQSLGELRCLNSCRHDNILPLYGFSMDGEHPSLVYQYMVNGSLEDRLLCRHRSPPLHWLVRYQIVRGVVCGIQFLHSIGSKPLIHGDIKSANILLDRNFEAKIGDFGLAREMPQGQGSPDKSYVKVSRVHGTRPYLPDEYLRSKKLSTKVDTYSFGIMLFEVATGQRAYEESRSKKFLRDVIEDAEGNYEPLRDPKGGTDNPDIFWHFIKVGRCCTEKVARNRPEMVQVLKLFDLFLSQQNTQASIIRTVSSQVTGIPLLFETPNSRPGSLVIPGGSATTHRLSPEMRATSPFWVPQGSQGQAQGQGFVGYHHTPPLPSATTTTSTNQSIPSNPRFQGIPIQPQNPPHQHQPDETNFVRRSPLPSPSPSSLAYPIPQMGNFNGMPGIYAHPPHAPPHPPQVLKQFGSPLEASNPFQPHPHLANIDEVPLNPANYGQHPPQTQPSAGPTATSRVLNNQNGDQIQNHPVPSAPAQGQISPHVTSEPQTQPPPKNSSSGTISVPNSEAQKKPAESEDDFLPVFLLEKSVPVRKAEPSQSQDPDPAEEGDEDPNDWTADEQDGPATVIPLITELGIKDHEQADDA